ncbi:hypothetical protein ES707_06544 [subsurface metagenome]
MMDEKRLTVSVDECAKLLGISRGLCFQMVHEGKIPHLRFNKRILIPKWAMERLLQEPQEPATSHQQPSSRK